MTGRAKHRRRPSIETAFRNLSGDMKNSLSNEQSALRLGMAALAIASERCQVEHLSVAEIVKALDFAGIAASHGSLTNAFSRAGSRTSMRNIDGVRKYKIMNRGIDEIRDLLGEGNLEVVYVEAGKPRTARKKMALAVADLEGPVRITDPYFGDHTLDTLEAIPETLEVRFLTARISGNEPRLRRLTQDLKRERPNLQIRIYPDPNELHDRYILSQSKLVIVGHGLKDIGNKESFLIVIDKDMAPDLIDSMQAVFDVKWGRSAAF